MTLKRFCDICKQEAIGGYACLSISANRAEAVDLCKECEKVVLEVLERRKK